jgi:prepilin-type processing-associated H-X9-DG protein
LLIQGSALTSIREPSRTIAIREAKPWFSSGKWIKTYGFADGHVEVRPEPPEGFEGWEKQHGLAATGP